MFLQKGTHAAVGLENYKLLTALPSVKGPHMKISCSLGILDVICFTPHTFNANVILKICLIMGVRWWGGGRRRREYALLR